MERYSEGLHKTGIFIIGSPGSDKSAFISFINNLKPDVEAAENSAENLKPQQCDTENSRKYNSSQSKIIQGYCDCISIQDTRSPDTIFAEKVSVYQDFKKFNKIKLVLIISSITLFEDTFGFIETMNNLVSAYNLYEKHFKSILVVFSKYKLGEIRNPVEYISKNITFDENLIIKALVKNQIRYYIWKHTETNNFTENDRQEAKAIIETLQFIPTAEFNPEKLEKEIYKIAKKARKKFEILGDAYNDQNSRDLTEVVFSRDINKGKYRITNKWVLILDEDVIIQSEVLELNAKLIIVCKNRSKLRKVTLIGSETSTIILGDDIDYISNQERLLISIKPSSFNKSKYFSMDFKPKFEEKMIILRLETIFINGFFTEWVTHNNKAIDLIIYINPLYGDILSSRKWQYKTKNTEIYGRLYINECMRTENNIRNNFLSFKYCFDELEYFSKLDFEIKNKVKKNIIKYAYKIPPLFHLLVNPKYFKFFQASPDILEIVEIKRMLIQRYLKLLLKFREGELEDLFHRSDLWNAYNLFSNFLAGIHPLLGLDESDLSEKIDLHLQSQYFYQDKAKFRMTYTGFISFFEALERFYEGKYVLRKFLISGDNNKYDRKKLEYTNESAFPGHGVLAGVLEVFGTGTLSAIGSFMAKNFTKIAAHSIKAGMMISAVAILGLELIANAIVAQLKTGFIKNLVIEF
jgi:hypothetical protein